MQSSLSKLLLFLWLLTLARSVNVQAEIKFLSLGSNPGSALDQFVGSVLPQGNVRQHTSNQSAIARVPAVAPLGKADPSETYFALSGER